MPLLLAFTGAAALHGMHRLEEQGISSRRYNSRTILTHLPFEDRRKTLEAKPGSDLESATERLRLVIRLELCSR
jgi:hypothetical protein